MSGVPFSATKLRVPRGFQSVLECLSKEVLRMQPLDVYAFGAIYLENLVKRRSETGFDPAHTGAQIEDTYYNNRAFVKAEDPETADHSGKSGAAVKIQTKFRQFSAKHSVESMKAETAACKIQAVYRGHAARQSVKKIRASLGRVEPEDDENSPHERVHPHPPEDVYDVLSHTTAAIPPGQSRHAVFKESPVKFQGDPEELDKAARHIQAGFRGAMIRKEIRLKHGYGARESIPLPPDEFDPCASPQPSADHEEEPAHPPEPSPMISHDDAGHGEHKHEDPPK